MDMDDEFLEINDLDWFASCHKGYVAHFATGGRGFVPFSIRASISTYELLYDYFYSLAESFEFVVVEENLPEFSNQVQRERYLKSFSSMARRGLFSYDVNDEGNGYKLVAMPVNGKGTLEISLDVRASIVMLPIDFFANKKNIDDVEFV
ncbi:hypothetical protein [Pseudomonas orientalis]|uniref:Uncharacterized protein n=1 Tax=Pseudomonas orientalis TaxID=76758 RepID=A0A8B3Y1E5_9PSED|nr:hypothetical protein [Pseudomonas orientalis]SDU23621.1 hypothetical protein SAMN04490197_4092 [Pseudomonas orientalis]